MITPQSVTTALPVLFASGLLYSQENSLSEDLPSQASAPEVQAADQQPTEESNAAPSAKPNVVLFVSDDMGWSDVSYHGGTVKTPNIDRIGSEGVELDRFYVFPICSPTRTALMTGRSPIRFGIIAPIGGRQGVPTDEHFLPETFQDAGYQTYMVGKWHLGKMGEAYAPQSRGFDHFYGFRGGVIDYYKHTGSRGLDWQRNGKEIVEEGYATELFAAEAVKLLKGRDKAKPVFLYVPFNAPHSPAQAPEKLIKDYVKQGMDRSAAARAASIDSMDQAIGKILKTLDDEGMTENTLTMFFCDNGAGGGRERRGNGNRRGRPGMVEGAGNAPLKGGKGSVYEGGIRVPAVLRWPSAIKAGTKSEVFISVQDLLPTLAGATGLSPGNTKPLDGTNQWPTLSRSESAKPKRKPFIVAGQGSWAILESPWKLVQRDEVATLYQVIEDPSETKDLAAAKPRVTERLAKLLDPFKTMLKDQPQQTNRRGQRGRGNRRRFMQREPSNR